MDALLAGGVGTLPLVPLAKVKQAELPGVIDRMKDRFRSDVRPSEEAMLWTATYLLMGLRYDDALTGELLKGVRMLEESVTYQAIIKKGEARGETREAQRILLSLGTDAFGHPDETTKTALAALTDREQLEAMIRRVAKVKSWEELLGKPRPRKRDGAKRR